MEEQSKPAGRVAVRDTAGPGHRIRMIRYDNQAHIVRHQAVAPDTELCLTCLSGQQLEVALPVVIIKKDIAAELVSLHNTVRAANGYHSGDTSHRGCSGFRRTFVSGKFRV